MLYSELSPTDQRALWQAFEKRFPVGLSKEFLLKESHTSRMVRVESSWKSIFGTLEEHPRDLSRLLRTATEMRPDDSNLCEMVELLCPPKPVGLFATIASVICMGIMATLSFTTDQQTPNAFVNVEQTQADLMALERFEQASYTDEVLGTIENIGGVDEPILLPDAGIEEQMHGSRNAPNTLEEVKPTIDSKALIAQQQTILTSPTLGAPSRCQLEGSGDLIGYWYAGDTAPLVENGWTTISRGVNVRTDFPEKHNDYNAQAPVSCVLHVDTKVPVQTDPILVAGGKYWVPLRSIPRG